MPSAHDLRGVGENVQDLRQIRLGFECTRPITNNDPFNSWIGKAKQGLDWLLHGTGALAITINQGCCFMQALRDESGRPLLPTPDIQFHLATRSEDMAGANVHPYPGFTMSVCQLRPASRGHFASARSTPSSCRRRRQRPAERPRSPHCRRGRQGRSRDRWYTCVRRCVKRE